LSCTALQPTGTAMKTSIQYSQPPPGSSHIQVLLDWQYSRFKLGGDHSLPVRWSLPPRGVGQEIPV
jgi:hypothetical protein